MKIKILICCILLLGLYLRLFQLSSLPISLYGDEIEVGYQAWSLGTTGKDYYGNSLPTLLQGFFEHRLPLVMYLTAPFIKIFGPNIFTVRFPTAIIGSISILLIYHVVKIIKDKQTAIIAAFLLSITPWHIHLSRGSFETITLSTLLLTSILFFLKGLAKPKYLWLSATFFPLTLYTYPIAAAITPLIIFLLYIIYFKKLKQINHKKYLILTLVIISTPFIYQTLFGQASGRFSQINIFSDQKTIDDIIIQRTQPWIFDNYSEKLFHNKISSFISVFGNQYLESFSPQFLYLNGDPHFRHSVSRFGELLYVTLPFLFLGLFKLSLSIKDKTSLFIILWLMISPLPSAITQGGGMHAPRLLPMLAPLLIIISIGLRQALELITNKYYQKIFIIFFLIVTFFNFSSYWHRYSNHYRYESARIWHNGFADIFSKLKTYQVNANKIYINNTYEPTIIQFAFHTQYPPIQFQENIININKFDSPMFEGFIFDEKYYFGQIKPKINLVDLIKPGDIYLAVQGIEIPGDWNWSENPPSGIKVIAYTKDVFNNPLFYLLTKE